jgi:hypothetical protein
MIEHQSKLLCKIIDEINKDLEDYCRGLAKVFFVAPNYLSNLVYNKNPNTFCFFFVVKASLRLKYLKGALLCIIYNKIGKIYLE